MAEHCSAGSGSADQRQDAGVAVPQSGEIGVIGSTRRGLLVSRAIAGLVRASRGAPQDPHDGADEAPLRLVCRQPPAALPRLVRTTAADETAGKGGPPRGASGTALRARRDARHLRTPACPVRRSAPGERSTRASGRHHPFVPLPPLVFPTIAPPCSPAPSWAAVSARSLAPRRSGSEHPQDPFEARSVEDLAHEDACRAADGVREDRRGQWRRKIMGGVYDDPCATARFDE